MGFSTWRRWLKRMAGSWKTSSPAPTRKRTPRLHLEALEQRLAPATYIWSGAGGPNNNWSNPANWVGNVAPSGSSTSLDDLVFDSRASQRSSVNDLLPASGRATFNSVTISASNYALSGNAITLGQTSVFGSGFVVVNSGSLNDSMAMDVQLGGPAGSNQFFTVNNGSVLTVSGHLSGTTGSSLVKEGTGQMILANDNSLFTGPIKVDNNAGILTITNANALGDTSSGTTVGQNSQLQVQNVSGPINEALQLNGPGPANDGALLSVAGTDTWAGSIQLGSATTLGAAAGSTLNISGQVSDLGAGQNLTKEGAGQVIFSHVGGNTYRGTTTINNGVLTIEDPLSLGEPLPGGATPSAANGTTVNQSLTGVGTLQLYDPAGVGFTVKDEWLTLNGPGANGLGALTSLLGNNTWAGPIALGSPAPNGHNVSIGASPNATLTVSGVVSNGGGVFSLFKVGAGTVVLNNHNTYTGQTFVNQGVLDIRDSQALGANGGGGTTVANGAALDLEVDTGFDAHGRNLAVDSVTGLNGNGPQLGMTIATSIVLNGTGINNTGALRSISGINVWTGPIALQDQTSAVAIGVDPDPNPSPDNTYFTHDYSLTVTGGISNYFLDTTRPDFDKVGTGQLILPGANTYTGTTNIEQGWVTIQNNQALGANIAGGDTIQPPVIVSNGAALFLKPLTAASAPLDLVKNLVLSGTGITHPFGLISQKGALINLGGNNIVGGPANNRSSDIQLNGVTGIGVELLGPGAVSELTVTSSIADATATTGGGITKLGSQRLDLEGDGTYTGPVTVAEGVLRLQNDTALGTQTTGTASGTDVYTTTTTTVGPGIQELQTLTLSGNTTGTFTLTFNGQTTAPLPYNVTPAALQTALNALSTIGGAGGAVTVNQYSNVYTVAFGGAFTGYNQPQLVATGLSGTLVAVNTQMNGDGSALELATSAPLNNGGLSSGIETWNEHLVLNSPGNATFGDTPLEVLGNDNMWQGPVTLQASTTIRVQPSARLNIFGTIDDATNPSPSGSDLTLTGGGELDLGGANTYAGTTYVNQGVLVLLNSQALGGTGIAGVQTVTVSGTSGTFTLNFNGQNTTPLNAASATLATDMQSTLNALSTIGGAGGSVTVSQMANVYTVTFGGSLFGFNQPQLTATAGPGLTVNVGTLVAGGGGTVVANGASIELQGSLTVAGEPLIIQGQGSATANNVPVGWFPEGPSPINNGQTPGNEAVSGRVTGVVVDPGDSNVIYIATAGGGAWKTKNGGLTWQPLFDLQNGSSEIQSVTVTGTSGTFTLTFNGATTGPLPYNATALQVQTALNALSTIGGMSGSVTVTLSGNVYTVTFAGDLAGANQAQMTATGTGGATAVVATVADGIAATDAMYVGAITMDPTNPQIIYVGTGETNNSADSFYGTGIYKSVDSGKDWTLVGGNNVQTLTVLGTAGTFTLTFEGQTTGPIDITSPNLASVIQAALTGLPTIGGAGGSVTVTQGVGLNSNVFTVTFGGTLNQANTNIPALGAAGTGGTTVLVSVVDLANPFYGKGISKIIVDPNSPTTLYVADGDGGAGRNETQSVNPNLAPGSTFTLTFTGPDATGGVVSDTTAPITYDPTNPAQTALNIQNALDALGNIGGVGAFVTVTPPRGRRGRGYSVTFAGTLSLTNVQQMTGSPAPPSLNITTTTDGGSALVINGTAGGPGIWRYMNGDWFNMTAVVSPNRASVATGNAVPPTQDANPTGSPTGTANPPMTPGPDDDYRMQFPTSAATWSDVVLVYTDITNTPVGNGGPLPARPVIYAALGTASGSINNGVFWCENPTSTLPLWYVGDPGGSPFSFPATPPSGVDARSSGEFPVGTFAVPFPSSGPPIPATPLNGNIKIAAVAGQWLNTTTVYASVATPTGTLRDVYVTNTGGQTWAPVPTMPPNYMASQGNYANAILAVNANTVIVGGYESNSATHLQQLFMTTDGGTTWKDLSVGADGNGPHTAYHALIEDSQGRLLAGTDGGVWRLELNGNWTDLNGDLEISQVNGVASDPTSLTRVIAGMQSNGTNVYNGGLTWTQVDGNGGGKVWVNPQNPGIIYEVQLQAGFNAVVRESTDAGQTWTTILNTLLQNAPLVLDQVNPSRLLAGGSFLEESLNGGASFTNLNVSVGGVALPSITAIGIASYQGTFAADPDFPLVTDVGSNTYDPNTIYVTDGNSVYLSKDNGQSWKDRTNDLVGLGGIIDLEVDPSNRDTVYAVRNAFGGQEVWMSTDAGQTWNDITNNLPDLPVWKLVVDPRNENIYVGTDEGVYLLPAGSTTWQHFGSGLPNVQVRDLVLNQTTNTLLAGTYGRGVYLLNLDDGLTNAGALRAVSGSSVWTGPVYLVGDPTTNTVTISANGTQAVQNGVAAAQLNIIGTISDLTPGTNSSPRLVKTGQGDVILSGPNTYGGVTEVVQGALIVHNSMALGGATLAPETQTITFGPPAPTTFSLNFNGAPTPASFTYTGGAGDLANLTQALQSLSTVPPGTLSVSQNGNVFTVTFGGVLNGFSLPLITAQATSGTGTATVALATQAQGGTVVDPGTALELESDLALESVLLYGDGIQPPFNGHNTGALRNVSSNNTFTGTLVLGTNTTVGVDPGTTLTVGASPTLLGTGTITDGGENLDLTKELIGTLILSSANTYGGKTEVNQGVLQVQHPQALGGTANGTDVFDGAQLQLQTPTFGPLAGQPVVVTGEALTLSGTGIFNTGALLNTGGSNTWNGPITLESNPVLLLPNNVPATTPPNHVAIGTASGGDTLTIAGSVGQTGGTFGLDKVGAGRVTLATADTYGGVTTVFAGLLRIQNGNALGTVANGTVVNAGAALEVDGDPTGVGASITVPEPLTLNGTGVGGTGALLNVSGNNTYSGSVTLLTNTAVGANAGTQLTVTGNVQDPTPAPVPAASLTKVGHGTVVFPNTNSYSGKTFVNDGILNIRNPLALGNSGPEIQQVTILGGNGTFTLTFNGQTTVALNINSPTLASDMQTALDNLSTIGGVGGTVTVAKGTGSSSNVYTVTFGGSLSNSNLPQMTATGTSGVTVMVSTVRDGPEGTVVNSGGTLQVQGGLLFSNESLTLNGPGFNNLGALDNAAGTSNTWANPITLGSNASVGADGAADTLTINQAIGDNGNGFGLTKYGPGTVQFVGATSNTYTGTTLVSDGTLLLNKTGGATAVAGNVVVGDGTPGQVKTDVLRLVGSSQIAPTAAVTVNSDGLFDLNDQAQTVGPLTILDGTLTTGAGTHGPQNGQLSITSLTMTGGTLNLNAAGSVVNLGGNVIAASSDALTGSATVNGSGTLALGSTTRTFNVNAGVAGDTDMVVATVIAGTGGLTKSGSGSLELTNTETYTGGTTVTAGGLFVDGPTGQVGNVSVTGGVLGGTGTVGVITATGGTVQPGGSPGSLPGILSSTAGGSLASGAAFGALIDGPTPGNTGTNYGQLNVAGPFNLGGATLTGTVGNGYVPAAVGGPTFTVLHSSGALSGTFAQGGTAFLSGMKFTVTYDTVNNNVNLNRILANTTTAIISATPKASTFGQAVTFVATVTPEAGATFSQPGGTVSFVMDGTVTLGTVNVQMVNGVVTATYTTNPATQLTGGTHTITAVYNADPNFAGSTSAGISYTVHAATTATTITAPTTNTNSPFGTPVTFVATVTPAQGTVLPTGTVAFKEGSIVIGSGTLADNGSGTATATFTTNGTQLAGGTHLVNAVFTPADGNYAASTSAKIVLNITPTATTTTITAPATNSTSVFGTAVTFTATVAPTLNGVLPTGMVTFKEGSIVLGSGTLADNGSGTATASYTTSPVTQLAAGVHTIIAVYGGDNNYATSTTGASITITVTPAATVTTITGASPASPSFGTPVTFTATVTPNQGTVLPSGSVAFMEGSTTLGTGIVLNVGNVATATYTTNPGTQLAGGAHTITAVFTPSDGNFSSSTSTNFSLTVNAAATVTTITAPANNSSSGFGTPVTFVATVTPNQGGVLPTGAVTFMDGTTALGQGTLANDGNGTATATFTTTDTQLGGGKHTITAVYVGTNNYATSTSAGLTYTVIAAPTTTTITQPLSGSSSKFGVQVTFTATVAPNVAGVLPTGTVTFVDVTNPANPLQIGQGTLADDGNGTATASFTTAANAPLPGGTHKIDAVYATDGNYAGSTSSAITYTVIAANSTTTLTTPTPTSPASFGTPVTFFATVTPNVAGVLPAGTVTFLDGSTVLGTGTLQNVNGTATANYTTKVDQLLGGTHSITASFASSNGDYNTSTSGSISYTVTPASTTTTVTQASPANPTFGQPVTLTATVTPTYGSVEPTGTVAFYDNGTLLGQGTLADNGSKTATATYTTTSTQLAQGSHPAITAVYTTADGNFSGSNSGDFSLTVASAPTVTKVTSSTPNPSNLGQPVTFTATVTPSFGSFEPQGTVTFYDNGSPLGNGTLADNGMGTATASYTTTSTQLGGGARTITAAFTPGNNNFAASTSGPSGSLTQNVNVGTTTTTITSASPASPTYGVDAINVTVMVAGSVAGFLPTKTVTLMEGTKPLGQSNLQTIGGQQQATIALSSTQLGGGANTLFAVYGGDANYQGSTSANFTVTVNKAGTTVALGSTNQNAVYGQAVITAKVSPAGAGAPTGNVTFSINNGTSTTTQTAAVDATGVATLPTPLNVGSYTITASYAGDGNFNGSATTQSLTQTVSQATSQVAVSSSAANPVFGQTVTFTATVGAASPGSGTPAGTVDFVIDGNVVATGVALKNGSATYSTNGLPVTGSPHTVAVNFHDADGNFTNGSGTLSGGQNVLKAGTSTSVTSTAATITFGQPVTFTATVAANSPSGATPAGTVDFVIDGSVLAGGVGLVNGTASFTTAGLSVTSIPHNVTVNYHDNSGNFSNSSGSLAGGLKVTQAGTTTTMVTDHPLYAVLGRIDNFVATVTGPNGAVPTGSVTFLVDGSPALSAPLDSLGRALFATASLPRGQHTVTAVYAGSTNFAGSNGPSISVMVLTPDEAFVEQAYLDLLNRPASSVQELDAWAVPLDQGLITRTNVAQGITGSLEYKIDTVDALYVKYLHRHADPGSAGFVNFLLNGGTDEQVASLLAGSDEYFFNRGGGTVDGFLNALFEDGLGRPVDPTGEAAFTQALAFNVSRQQVAFTVLASFEHDLNFVAGIYQKLLHRNPDVAGQVGWANLMQMGIPDELIIDSIVGSDEYFFNL